MEYVFQTAVVKKKSLPSLLLPACTSGAMFTSRRGVAGSCSRFYPSSSSPPPLSLLPRDGFCGLFALRPDVDISRSPSRVSSSSLALFSLPFSSSPFTYLTCAESVRSMLTQLRFLSLRVDRCASVSLYTVRQAVGRLAASRDPRRRR